MWLIILFCFLPTQNAYEHPFDFIENALEKIVDWKSDPCDDFYRHACPVGSIEDIIKVSMQPLKDALNHSWKQKGQRNEGKVYNINFRRSHICCHFFCKLLFIYYDYQYRFINYVTFYDGMLQPLYYHVEANVTDGINEIHQMMEDMVELGNIWLEKTPWVINNNLTEEMKNITNAIKMPVSLTKYTNFIYNLLSPIETDFLNCVSEFEGIQNNTLFCLFYSAKIFVRTRGSYFIDDNGYNAEGTIYFGFPNYYHTTYGNWRASKLGYTGTRVGHEIGHTFIEHSINPDGLPYFSKPAEDCVQNQYLKTCNEYYEGEVPDACNTSDYTFDDNGADVFGLQLAYAILERDLSDQLREQADGLKITNEQLLFYSFAYRFCRGSKSNTTDGSHSHHNVRINAVAQMPGFQQAFNCASDSRMMKSATKQCVIYGNNAPETRK